MRTSPVKEVGAVLAREREALGELAHELDDLRDVVVVLAVPRAGRGVKEVVAARDELEDLSEPSQSQSTKSSPTNPSGGKKETSDDQHTRPDRNPIAPPQAQTNRK